MSSERIAYYTVKYYPRDVLRPVHVERKVYSESIIMTGLTPGKEYSISVQSHHEAEANGHPDVSTTHKYCKISLTGMMCKLGLSALVVTRFIFFNMFLVGRWVGGEERVRLCYHMLLWNPRNVMTA